MKTIQGNPYRMLPIRPEVRVETPRFLLKTNGEIHVYEDKAPYGEISRLVAEGRATDTVSIRHGVEILIRSYEVEIRSHEAEGAHDARMVIPAGWVMIVDDTGLVDGKPLNALASRIYRSQCRPEFQDQAVIAGDAFLCPDEDFA